MLTERSPAPAPAIAAPAPSPPSLAPAPATAGSLATALAQVPPASPAGATQAGLPEPAAVTVPAGVPAEPVELVGGAPLAVPDAVAAYLEAASPKGAPVRARLGALAAGVITVQKKPSGYVTPRQQPIPLAHPLFLPLRTVGMEPVLAVRVGENGVEGCAGVLVKQRLLAGKAALPDALAEHAATLGWRGLDRMRIDGVTNELQGSTLVLQVSNLRFGVAGFLVATGSLGLANEIVTLDATATGTVPGLGTITVPIRRAPDGSLTGQATVDVALRGFAGQVTAAFGNGAVDVSGKVRYTADKFDGEVTIVATDKASAKALTDSRMPAQAEPAAGAAGTPAVPAPAPSGQETAPPAAGPRPGPRVVAGWGTVNVRLADWLSGDAMVVVDHAGDVTVVGKITPKMDKPLFEQRDYIYPLPKLEVRALYGVPLVGNVFVFANVGLEAVAKIGPATLQRMEMTGTWSTKPDVLQSFGLTGTLNVSAFAGLRLTAEGGVGVEILDHDIKAGLAVSALAGVRGYVEATPRIGYREIADPKAGKRGEFFIGGHMELAAQPFLGLGGELFVELDSPWWSPAPDDRWTWPLGQLEYPLPGEFGIGADVEHVLGSGQIPEVKFGAVQFSAEKFLTDLVSDHVPPKAAKDEQKAGTWKEGAPAGGGESPPTVEGAAPPAPTEPARGKQDPAAGAVPKPEVEKRWLAGMKALGALAETGRRDPQDEHEISSALAGIKSEYGFTTLSARLSGANWLVRGTMNPDSKDGKKEKEPSVPAAPETEPGAVVEAGTEPAAAQASPVPDVPRRELTDDEKWAQALGALEKQKEAKDPSTPTEHGALREQERGKVTDEEWGRLESAFPRRQPDGTIVRVLKEKRTGYTVVITRPDGGLITVIRNKTPDELRGMSTKNGWDPPWS